MRRLAAVRCALTWVASIIIGLPALRRECRKNAVEHAEPALADEAVVNRLVRTVGHRRIPPAQPIPDHEDEDAVDTSIIARGTPCDWNQVPLNSPACSRFAVLLL